MKSKRANQCPKEVSMKLASTMAAFAIFCGISLFAPSKAEAARVNVGINFGCCPGYVQERVYVPYERVYVPAYPCYERVYVPPTPVYREVYVAPGCPGCRPYPPRGGFSVSYWR